MGNVCLSVGLSVLNKLLTPFLGVVTEFLKTSYKTSLHCLSKINKKKIFWLWNWLCPLPPEAELPLLPKQQLIQCTNLLHSTKNKQNNIACALYLQTLAHANVTHSFFNTSVVFIRYRADVTSLRVNIYRIHHVYCHDFRAGSVGGGQNLCTEIQDIRPKASQASWSDPHRSCACLRRRGLLRVPACE